MRHRALGRSGLRVSRLGLGTMTWGSTVDAEDARDQLTAFVEAGGSLVDTAFPYGAGASEELLGSLLGDVVPRDEVVLCTKSGLEERADGWVRDTSRRELLRQLDTSLRRLSTDHVDLWLVHTWSDEVPLEETVKALAHAVATGRATYVGVSNHRGWQAARTLSLLEREGLPMVADQVQYSLIHRAPEADLAPAAASLGFGLLPWSPLGRGILTGKYRSGVPSGSRAGSAAFPRFVERYLDERAMRISDAVATAARGLQVTPTEVALAWVRDRPGVVAPVVGARTVGQLRTSLASEELELPAELVEALDEVSAAG
ncbi:aldo/keto reductase [Lapillicoccus jejuensis]|uniref:Aryl-alcohol dehydrogenase-like predicted oxidoreductase n=1 Tax=Lapillicoccus jejuensis TaxID=402171 RepID=A0A542E4N0_9MICO|nr:aldo/keto reductase [Lapillicoccus jejuensis]TQJ10277.1 aryl-alcohol dehydrogenase-like predicted oxidoreductase [Lapillicoccus jejuensis]